MDLTTDQLLRVAFDIAAAEPSDLPEGLEARVLARARASTPMRHPAWSDDGAPLGSLDAFIQTAVELADLLDHLGPTDWERTTRVDDVSVRGVIEHLVGVERYVLGQLGRRTPLDAPRRADHWPVTNAAALDLTNQPNAVVAQRWWSEVLAVIAACAELGPEQGISYHHLAGSLRGMLVVRTFELWTHGDDIRHGVGLPLSLIDDARLALMAGEMMRVLPLGLELSGCPQPGRTARLNLRGAGGGSFDVTLAAGETVGPPDITLTAEVIDLCRLAANRLARADFDVTVEGDESLLEPILVGAAAFAAD